MRSGLNRRLMVQPVDNLTKASPPGISDDDIGMSPSGGIDPNQSVQTARRLTRWLLTAVVTATLLGAACAPGVTGTGPDPVPTMTDAPSGRALPEPSAEASRPDPASFTTPEAVDCDELPREPTEIEAGLLVQPGAFSGDDFDLDAALDAVVAQEPGNHGEWVDAIVGQVQGDYAQAVCEAIRFSAEMGDGETRPTSSQAPGPESELGTGNHFALVLDASGSMAARTGGGTRMDAARTAMTRFVASLPDGSSISLRVYGHEGGNTDADKAVSCASSAVLFEGLASEESFVTVVGTVQPVGWTPLAKAISLVQEDIPEDAAAAVVYIVTDGKETCGGDPVVAATQLAAGGVEPIINVIGFEADDADQAALQNIADAGNGQFVTASSVSELDAFWNEEYKHLNQAWNEWVTAEKERVAMNWQEMKLEVDAIVGTIRLTAGVDLPHAQAISQRLEERGFVEQDAKESMDRSLNWYFSDVRTYAGIFEFDGDSALLVNGFDATFGAAGESYDAWREAYERRIAEDE